jgi:hypothetical protein
MALDTIEKFTVIQTPKAGGGAKPHLMAEIEITIDEFRPLGSPMTITATMVQKKGAPTVTLDRPYYIKVRKPGQHNDDPNQEVLVRFWLDQPKFMFLGIYFYPADTAEFPAFTIEQIGNRHALTVLAARPNRKTKFEYCIAVQDRATSVIGVIDPEWENEP